MIYFEFLFSCILSFIQLIIANNIFDMVSINKKCNTACKLITVISFAMIQSVIKLFIFNFFVHFIVFLLSIGCISLLYTTKLWKKLLTVASCAIVIKAMEILLAVTIYAIFNAAFYNSILFISCALFFNLIIYGLLKIISDYDYIASFKIFWQTTIAFIILPSISLLIVALLTFRAITISSGFDNFILPIETILLLVVNLAVSLFYNYINILKTQEKKYKTKIETIEREKEFYYDLTQKYIVSNKAMHDLKNRLFAIENMIDPCNDNARQEIQQICDIVKNTECKIFTGIAGVDNLINAKIKTAEEKSIYINVKSVIAELVEYNIADICALLGNVLDNAIVATEEVIEDRNIELSLLQVEENICISVVNPVARFANAKFSKKEPLLHGYGLQNVRDIVRKYGGDCRYGIENKKFSIFILI